MAPPPFLPGFSPGTGTDGPRHADTPRPGATRDALHHDLPGTAPGPVPHPARAAAGEPDAAGHRGRPGLGPQGTPRPPDRGVPPGEPGPRPGPGRERSPRDGDRGPEGRFTA